MQQIPRVGSSTIVVEEEETPATILRLRAPIPNRRVRWETDVIDNEHMNKKKTKICCIFHKQRNFDESSSEEESSCESDSGSSSSSDSDSDSDGAGHNDNGKGKPNGKSNHHKCDHNPGRPRKVRRTPSPNAYEKQKPIRNSHP